MRLINMNRLIRYIYPLRAFMGRFIIDETQELFYKAGNFVAYSKIKGDYLEFGTFFGGSFASAFHMIKEHTETVIHRLLGTMNKTVLKGENYGER